MIDRKVIALGLLLPLAVAAPVLAQDAAAPGAEMFAQLDANGDGALSLEEIQNRPGRFERADANGDGAITPDEMLAQAEERAQARVDRFFENFDSDGDGAVTQAEITEVRGERDAERSAERAERMFDRADADGDGQISAEEFAEAGERMRDRNGRDGRDGRDG